MLFDLRELTKQKKELGRLIEINEEEVKEYKKSLEECERKIIQELGNEGQKSAKFPSIGTVYYSITKHPSITDKEGFVNYLEETDQDAIRKKTINHQTFVGWYNSKVKKDPSFTNPCIGVYTKAKVTLRRS